MVGSFSKLLASEDMCKDQPTKSWYEDTLILKQRNIPLEYDPLALKFQLNFRETKNGGK